MNSPIKDFLKAILVTLLPLLFSLFVGEYPDFPLDVGNFSKLILWIIGLLIGGWQSAFYFFKYDLLKTGRRWSIKRLWNKNNEY